MRIVFCGTPEFAVPSLRALAADSHFSIEAVVTQPDRPRGRGGQVHSPPVKDFALQAGLRVYQPEKIKSESALNFFRHVAPDAVAIVAYGKIVPPDLLAVPQLGWINLHASLLPAYRGAAPSAWAIARGEQRTGLTTMLINSGLDTGDMLLRWETEIGPDETSPDLAQRMAQAGGPLLVDTLKKLAAREIFPVPQDHSQASFAPLLKKEHGRIDWSSSAQRIYDRIRGFTPWPGAYSTFRGALCHIWGRPTDVAPPLDSAPPPGSIVERGEQLLVACGSSSWLRVDEVQLEGRKRVTARAFANGAHLQINERFS